MLEELIHAYTPLLIWIGLGLLFSRITPNDFLRFLGKALYWVGVPLQLLVLARQTKTSGESLIPVAVSIGVLGLSLTIALGISWVWQWFQRRKPDQVSEDSSSIKASLGSFILATILGNTGFVGLTLTRVLTTHEQSLNNDWAVLFSVTNNVVGTYGIAILIASYFGKKSTANHWWMQLRDLLTVPSLWAFFLGLNTQFIQLPEMVESALNQSVLVVIACALLLVGLRLGMIDWRKSLTIASTVTIVKVLIIPLIVGLVATAYGVIGEERLVLVLMSGTPTGLSVLILAEVYDLDRDLLASSIALTFVGLFLALPLWLFFFA